jgi:outer membrane immunogenic protein
MRWVISAALAVLTLAPPAFAADLGILPGPQPVAPGGSLPVGPATFTRWSGFYVGGQIGYGDANADFSAATQAPFAYALRETAVEQEFNPSQWPVLGSASSGGAMYGGFVGYNTQWQDLIVGVEANFNYAPLTVLAPFSGLGRITPMDGAGNTYNVNITSGGGSLTNIEYSSLRGRAGWVLGNFLPYGFAGFALGLANYSITVNPPSQVVQNPSGAIIPLNFTVGRDSALLYGFDVGGGLDVALTPNVFVRGELEYVQFAPIAGIVAGIASARVGAGFKF